VRRRLVGDELGDDVVENELAKSSSSSSSGSLRWPRESGRAYRMGDGLRDSVDRSWSSMYTSTGDSAVDEDVAACSSESLSLNASIGWACKGASPTSLWSLATSASILDRAASTVACAGRRG
jgi:hypothetical protein